MRIMYDGLYPDRFPKDATMVASYTQGGKFPSNYQEMVTLFPKATHVSICVFDTGTAQVLDVETGDATPAQSVGWVKRMRSLGVDPTIYCNTSTWPQVVNEFNMAGVTLPHWWSAQYDNVAILDTPPAVAKQYTDRADIGNPFDVSIVADYWPGVDPPPVVSIIENVRVTEMGLLMDADKNVGVLILPNGKGVWVHSGADYQNMEKGGYPAATVSHQLFTAIQTSLNGFSG